MLQRQLWVGNIPQHLAEREVLGEMAAYGVRPWCLVLRTRPFKGQDPCHSAPDHLCVLNVFASIYSTHAGKHSSRALIQVSIHPAAFLNSTLPAVFGCWSWIAGLLRDRDLRDGGVGPEGHEDEDHVLEQQHRIAAALASLAEKHSSSMQALIQQSSCIWLVCCIQASSSSDTVSVSFVACRHSSMVSRSFGSQAGQREGLHQGQEQRAGQEKAQELGFEQLAGMAARRRRARRHLRRAGRRRATGRVGGPARAGAGDAAMGGHHGQQEWGAP